MIDIAINQTQLNALLDKVANIPRRELLETIVAKMAEQVQERIFVEKTSPDGQPWAAWSIPYAKTRRANNSLLVGTGYLMQSVVGQVIGDDTAMVSTALPYARRQNDGGGGIPARPYMGLSQANEAEIIRVTEIWFKAYLDDL